MSSDYALVIFTKNMVYGSVKTRLAATVGKDKAYEVYKALVAHTKTVTEQLLFDKTDNSDKVNNPGKIDKIVFYSDFIEQEDLWTNEYKKQKQEGADLGEKMEHAFRYVFNLGYRKVVIIGTDCPQLTGEIIRDAFIKLDDAEVVIGPAADGGYYLLGMKTLYPQLFRNIPWSTHTVFSDTIDACGQLSYSLLPLLRDVDREEDLEFFKPVT